MYMNKVISGASNTGVGCSVYYTIVNTHTHTGTAAPCQQFGYA